MTKLKNTKKGMAKKALSISLVAAMLATSNVPVWAAEDLFSDGSVAVEAEAPVDDVDVFTEAPVEDEAPVVEEVEAGSQLQAAADYTVDTNVELNTTTGDWSGKLKLDVPAGTTDAAKLNVTKGNTDVTIDGFEVYYNDDMQGSFSAATDLTAINAALQSIAAPGVGVYTGGGKVTVKVYADGEKAEAVADFSYQLKAYDISGTPITYASETIPYDGKIYTPSKVSVGPATQDNGEIIVKYEKSTDGQNVNADGYAFYAEGVEEKGYTGTTAISSNKLFIEAADAATAKKEALTVAVSGDTTYNGKATVPPTVVITDVVTGAVIPSDLYTVTTSNTKVGTYDAATTAADAAAKKYPLGVTVTMKADNGKTGADKIVNNFKGAVKTDLITGSYTVSALDLSKLSSKYDIAIASKAKGEAVTLADITLTDKATQKQVNTEDVLGTGDSLVKITTSNNTTAGTGTVTIIPAAAGSTDVINSYVGSFTVASKAVTTADVQVPKGTKIGTTAALTENKTLAAVDATIKAELNKSVYSGSPLETLKDVFENLVWTQKSIIGDDIKLVKDKDYKLIYTDNTDSKEVSKKDAKVTLQFIGDFSGSIEYTFEIKQATATVTGEKIPYVAGKNSYDANVKVVVGSGTDAKAVPTTDYTVKTTVKATKVGEKSKATVTFTNKNYTNSSASVEVESEVIGKSLKDASVTAAIEGNYTYTGKAINPTIVVKDGTTVLKEGTDYKVVSKSGIEAGEASVTIEGAGNYSEQLILKYTIAKAALKDASLVSTKPAAGQEKNYDQPYNGQVQGPDIVVKVGDKTLEAYDEETKKGDYTITFDEDAKEVGTYNYTITAAASSTRVEGTVTGTYSITASKLKAQFVKKSAPNYTGTTATQMTPDAYYTGKAITLADLKTKYVLVDENSKVLTEDKDYRVEYVNNTDAGVATVYAYGLGNHEYKENGKEVAIATANFNIIGVATPITSASITAVFDTEYAGGLPVEPKVTVKVGNKTLVQGIDYTVKTTVTEVKDDYKATDVKVFGKGAYIATNTRGGKENEGVSGNNATIKWAVTQKDMKNTTITVDGENVVVMNGTVMVPSSEYDVKFSEDGKTVTVSAKANSKNYTGSQEKETDEKAVGIPVIKEVKVTNNKANIILSGAVDNAIGYDYVVSTVNDYKNGRVAIDKNQLATQSTIQYLPKGEYYAYLHAWKRVDGKKVFGKDGGWSNIVKFTVTTTTPDQPLVISAVAKGSTVTVKYTNTKNATGYDIVLGSETKKVNGELRPVEYGKLVKKITKGNVVTATFKNVPKGTYYAGLHAYNRTSVNNSKVFSPWSNSKKVVVK